MQKKIILVCDNLNTHSIGALYDTFEPGLARSLVRRLEIVPTPKHGSWLNIAENQLSALTNQCVKGRRFGTIDELREEVMAWAMEQNKKIKASIGNSQPRTRVSNYDLCIPIFNFYKALEAVS